MGFQMLLDIIGFILMIVALLSMFFGFGVWFSPLVLFDLGVSLYLLPRILLEMLGGE